MAAKTNSYSVGSDNSVGGSVIYSNDEKYEENDFPPSINATIWNNFGSDCCWFTAGRCNFFYSILDIRDAFYVEPLALSWVSTAHSGALEYFIIFYLTDLAALFQHQFE